ncbi:MAD3 protein, partial [Geococcyx californianus]|nr:MAD3 protein [Geococcyx californianus]
RAAMASSIQVLLQAAEFLERRECGVTRNRPTQGLAEAEHGYASLCPARARRALGSGRGPRAARGPHSSGTRSRLTGSLQRLEEQELRARRAKDQLRNRQRNLQQQLEWLLSPAGGERARANSLDSSQLSEPSEEEDAEIEVDGVVFGGVVLPGFSTGRDHSYSSPCAPTS